MAYFDDVEKRARDLNPALDEICKVLNKELIKAGATGSNITFVEGMTDEEEEMAIFAGYLKEGHSPEVAAVKAKESHAKVKEAFRRLDEMPRKGKGK